MTGYWFDIGLIAMLMLGNGIFAGSETALISLREGQLRALERRGTRPDRTLARLARDPNRYLGTIQLGITLAGFLASATAAVTLARPVASSLGFLGAAANPVAIALVTLMLAGVNIVIGELAPKRLAMQYARRWSRLVAVPLNFLATRSSGLGLFLDPLQRPLHVALVAPAPKRTEQRPVDPCEEGHLQTKGLGHIRATIARCQPVVPMIDRVVTGQHGEPEFTSGLACGDLACCPVHRADLVSFDVPTEAGAELGTRRAVEPLGFEGLRREPAGVADISDELPNLVGGRFHMNGYFSVHRSILCGGRRWPESANARAPVAMPTSARRAGCQVETAAADS